MNLALFGGTFDPVHCGHIAAAGAARDAFALEELYFVPAAVPPHKVRPAEGQAPQRSPDAPAVAHRHEVPGGAGTQPGRLISPFIHRYAMVALACAGTPFTPSLLEAPPERMPASPNYSLDTVTRVKAGLAASDRLFFIVGADSFLHIAGWHRPAELLRAVNFIIVSRPGFSMDHLEDALPREISAAARAPGRIELGETALYLLDSVRVDVSASAIRRAVAEGAPLTGLVPEPVADYISKQKLYRSPFRRV